MSRKTRQMRDRAALDAQAARDQAQEAAKNLQAVLHQNACLLEVAQVLCTIVGAVALGVAVRDYRMIMNGQGVCENWRMDKLATIVFGIMSLLTACYSEGFAVAPYFFHRLRGMKGKLVDKEMVGTFGYLAFGQGVALVGLFFVGHRFNSWALTTAAIATYLLYLTRRLAVVTIKYRDCGNRN